MVIAIAIGIQTGFIAAAMAVRPHMVQRIGRIRVWPFVFLVSGSALWMLISQTVVVWLWAIILMWVEAFDALEPALYFALAAYTTLGFGDVLPPLEWRILGGMIGANGMLGFGLAAAALVEFVTQIRRDLQG